MSEFFLLGGLEDFALEFEIVYVIRPCFHTVRINIVCFLQGRF